MLTDIKNVKFLLWQQRPSRAWFTIALRAKISLFTSLRQTSLQLTLLNSACKISLPPSTIPIGYLCDKCIGPVFSYVSSATLLDCFGQVMHILGIKIALIFPICTSVFPVSLFRPYKVGIVLKFSIVRVVQGWPVWSPAGEMLYPFQNPSHHLTFRAAC